MFNVNGMDAILVQNNRTTDEFDYYDDQNKTQIKIKVCPYNVDQTVNFGVYTVPEATGYFIVKGNIDVKEGDELIFKDHTYSILKVQDNWIWNKVANIILAVK